MNNELAAGRPGAPFEMVRFPSLELRLSTLFVLGVLLLSVGMFESFLQADDQAAGSGIISLQIAWGCVYATILAWAILDVRRVTALLFRSKLFLLAPLFALASTFWAQHPAPTLRRAIGLLFTYLLGAFLAVHCDRMKQLKLLCSVLLVSAALSFVVELIAPGWVPVIEAHPGSWNGVFPHKNMLARAMVILATALLCLEPRTAGETWMKRGGIVAALTLLVLSRAATGILVMAVLLFCFFVVRQVRRGMGTIVVLGMVALACAIVGSLFADSLQNQLLQFLGKSSDLSGRTNIWAVSIISIAKRPLLGYGFHGFWRENNEALVARSFLSNHWDAPHAHNGYIETLLELGSIGLVVIFGGVLVLFWKSLTQYRRSGELIYLWPVMLALMLLFYNISESNGMVENSLNWILFTAAFFTAAAEQQGPSS